MTSHPDSPAPSPNTAPAEAAASSHAPAAPHTPPAGDSGVGFSPEMEAAIDEAMAAAAGDHPKSRKADKADKGEKGDKRRGRHLPDPGFNSHPEIAPAEKPKIRGPRRIESGRENRTGKVVSIGPTDIFIEFGPKELGVVPRIQFPDEKDLPTVGGEFTVVVDRYSNEESLFICSRPGAVQKADWEMLEPGTIVEAVVTGTNKGGLEMEVAKHRAFMPASQIDTRRIEDLTPFVGQKLKCKVTRVDRAGGGNIVLSRRDILAEERKESLSKLKDSLKEGDIIEGRVTKIMAFGAFVDMGGVDGLLHISDLSHDRVGKVEKVVKEGETVRVKILKLDWENDRHSLGLKQLSDHPFDAATKDIVEGAEITGRVSKLTEFGAFIALGEGEHAAEGLCHISELDWRRVAKTSDVVQPNQIVKVKVLKIDRDSKKISLSIKQAKPRPEGERGGPGGPGGPGGRPGRGRGRDFVEDTRTPEEILKETPALRRLREQAKAKHGAKSPLKSGLGSTGSLGMGLGDLKL
ncbi:MAG: S1 RNA-binding domain-containing protein [Phycisphaerales bacterium]|nr:S1 RNA-binding domain-containing protein [Phycisphaerales bacterium]